MATAFLTAEAAATHPPHDFKPGSNLRTSVYTVTAGAALVINDTIGMVKVPIGARVGEIVLTVTDMDTSTGILLDVGDSGSANRYIAASTIGQTGGTVRLGSGIITATSAFTYTADDIITVKVNTAATGTAATTFTLSIAVFYTTDLS